jgi:hypothetical protein
LALTSRLRLAASSAAISASADTTRSNIDTFAFKIVENDELNQMIVFTSFDCWSAIVTIELSTALSPAFAPDPDQMAPEEISARSCSQFSYVRVSV